MMWKKNLVILIAISLSSCAVSFDNGNNEKQISLGLSYPALNTNGSTASGAVESRIIPASAVNVAITVAQNGAVLFEKSLPFVFDYTKHAKLYIEVPGVDLHSPIEISASAIGANGAKVAGGALSLLLSEADEPTVNMIPVTSGLTTVTSTVLSPGSYLIAPNNYSYPTTISPDTALTPGIYSLVIQDSITGVVIWELSDISSLSSYSLVFNPGQLMVVTWLPKVMSPTGAATIRFLDGGW